MEKRYRVEISQMMFTSGEISDPLPETTDLIEDIVRAQVIELLQRATQLATQRSSKQITAEDLIYLVRHNRAKVSRLTTYLTWKDVRKNARDDGDAGGAAAGAGAAGVGSGTMVGDEDVAAAAAADERIKLRRQQILLPWSVSNMFGNISSLADQSDDMNGDNTDQADENEDDSDSGDNATIARLRAADERTKKMTRDEYVHYSECRQASFTFRKAKRFREWCNMAAITEAKPGDDIIDILGFLTSEIVVTLTETALQIRNEIEQWRRRKPESNKKITNSALGTTTAGKNANLWDQGIMIGSGTGAGIFQLPEEGKPPLEPEYIAEAYRRLQKGKIETSMRNYRKGYIRETDLLI